MHEAGEAQEPGWGDEVWTPGNIIDVKNIMDADRYLHEDALGHEELCTVDDQSWEMTEKKDDDNTDKNARKIHFIIS